MRGGIGSAIGPALREHAGNRRRIDINMSIRLGPWTEAQLTRAPRRGVQKWLGLKLLSIARSQLTAELVVRSCHTNSLGFVHGGVLMSLGDSLGGLAALQNLAPGQATATLESKTNFLRPARGPTLRADCQALHVGGQTSVWQTTVRNQRQQTVAIITQTQLHYLPRARRSRPSRQSACPPHSSSERARQRE